jgi:hypothetical protein
MVTLDAPLVAVVAIGDALLIVACWRHRAAVAGVAAAAGIPLIVFAVTNGLTNATAEAALVIAVIFQITGTALLVGGELLDRLLDDGREPTGEQ